MGESRHEHRNADRPEERAPAGGQPDWQADVYGQRNGRTDRKQTPGADSLQHLPPLQVDGDGRSSNPPEGSGQQRRAGSPASAAQVWHMENVAEKIGQLPPEDLLTFFSIEQALKDGRIENLVGYLATIESSGGDALRRPIVEGLSEELEQMGMRLFRNADNEIVLGGTDEKANGFSIILRPGTNSAVFTYYDEENNICGAAFMEFKNKELTKAMSTLRYGPSGHLEPAFNKDVDLLISKPGDFLGKLVQGRYSDLERRFKEEQEVEALQRKADEATRVQEARRVLREATSAPND